MNNNIFEDNLLFKSQFGEIEDLISKTNIEVLKCYKDFYNKKYFFSCIGGFFIFGLIIIQIIMTIIYFNKSLLLIRKYIFGITGKYILYLSSSKFFVKEENDLILSSEPPKKKRKRKSLIKETNENESIKKRSDLNSNKLKTEICIKKGELMGVNFKEKYKGNYKNIQSTLRLPTYNLKKSSKRNLLKTSNDSKIVNQLFQYESNAIELMNYANDYNIDMNDYLKTDINDMEYDDVIKKDQRNFSQYLKEKLLVNQIILNTFITKDPLIPRTIKILLFILDIDLYLFVNALFFNEDYISEVFHSTKKEEFFTFVPRSYSRFFYTTLVGVIVDYIMDFFFVEEKKMKRIFIREKDNLLSLKYEISQMARSITKRLFSFIILSFIVTIFTLYYIFCLHSVYPHMRDEWIKSSIIIILIMQIISILKCLLETILRFISFKCKSEKIYKLSLILS